MLTAWMLFLVAAADPLHVPTPTTDAGEVFVGQALVRRFALVNSSQTPITVTDIKASCGCAAPSLPERTLAPGQRTELTLDVNTLSQPAGPIRWAIQIKYRAGTAEFAATAELTARLTREIEIQPASLALTGGPGFAHEIVLIDRRPKSLTMTAVRTDTPHLDAAIVPTSGGIRVRIAETCPEGAWAGTLRIATNDPKYPELCVPIAATCKRAARFTAVPSRAMLIAGGSALIQLRGDGLRIDRIETSHPAMTTRWTDGPGHNATIRVGLDKSKWNGEPFSGEIKVLIAEPPGEQIKIPVSVRNDD